MTFAQDHPVYLAIREQLMLGHRRPGDPLRPVEIADSLRVSVSPVREALIRLSERGLVSSVAQLGFVVSHFDATTTVHYYRLMAQLYDDSISKIAAAGHMPAAARLFADGLRAVARDGQVSSARCLQYVALCGRVLLAKPYRAVVDRIGDVCFAHAAVAVGSDQYYKRLAGEFTEFGRQLQRGDISDIRLGGQQFFTRRADEITQAEARLVLLPSSTGSAPRRRP